MNKLMYMQIFLGIFLLTSIDPTLACSIAASTYPLNITGEASIAAKPPRFTVQKIQRGSNDPSQGSCADIGMITLVLVDSPNAQIGYQFEISEGNFEKKLFPTTAVQAIGHLENGGKYKFAWLDGRSKIQEPIDIQVKITAINIAGETSEPSYLEIKHPGVKNTWWKFWQ